MLGSLSKMKLVCIFLWIFNRLAVHSYYTATALPYSNAHSCNVTVLQCCMKVKIHFNLKCSETAATCDRDVIDISTPQCNRSNSMNGRLQTYQQSCTQHPVFNRKYHYLWAWETIKFWKTEQRACEQTTAKFVILLNLTNFLNKM